MCRAWGLWAVSELNLVYWPPGSHDAWDPPPPRVLPHAWIQLRIFPPLSSKNKIKSNLKYCIWKPQVIKTLHDENRARGVMKTLMGRGTGKENYEPFWLGPKKEEEEVWLHTLPFRAGNPSRNTGRKEVVCTVAPDRESTGLIKLCSPL